MDIEMAKVKCCSLLDEVSECFTDDCKFTLLVRKPENTEADFVLTDDSKEEIIAAILRRL